MEIETILLFQENCISRAGGALPHPAPGHGPGGALAGGQVPLHRHHLRPQGQGRGRHRNRRHLGTLQTNRDGH